MQAGPKTKAAARPRLDGRRVLFEVETEGRAVACAISLTALQDLGMRRHFKPDEALQCFERERPRIEAAVLHKLHTRVPVTGGLLNIWADDVDDTPEEAPAPEQPRGD